VEALIKQISAVVVLMQTMLGKMEAQGGNTEKNIENCVEARYSATEAKVIPLGLY
jgi:hypothetical protein